MTMESTRALGSTYETQLDKNKLTHKFKISPNGVTGYLEEHQLCGAERIDVL